MACWQLAASGPIVNPTDRRSTLSTASAAQDIHDKNWAKTLSLAIKTFVKSGKLVKVKNSYKLGEKVKVSWVRVCRSGYGARVPPGCRPPSLASQLQLVCKSTLWRR